MDAHSFTAGFLFCGLGAGARGFLDASAHLGEHEGCFCALGGVDNDPLACADFERLTGVPATCADLSAMQPAQLRAAWGDRAPDVIFTSPPCKGFSGLVSKASSEKPIYQKLNKLVLQGFFLACETWPEPPSLLVLENVPRITTRGAELLRQVRQLLGAYGYVFTEGYHDCGEIGGLAQHRRRFLMVARRPSVVPNFVYRPPRQRVRACGEVLGALPLPEDPSAGELHRLPRLSWLNWARLALIPAGGDWRDLPKSGAPALAQTAAGAASFKGRPGLMGVNSWEEPAPTVAGAMKPAAGSVAASVADPRLALSAARTRFSNKYQVRSFDAPAGTVTGDTDVQEGAPSIADPRIALGCTPRNGAYGVAAWDRPACTVTGSAQVDNCPAAVADPRIPQSYRLLTVEQALAEADRARTPAAGVVPVILSPRDGTWHRPLTTLELATLQGLPVQLDGAPLSLAGRATSAWRERIGNAVPVGAGKAIGSALLQALLAAQLGTWTLGSTGIWVRPQVEEASA